nr:hypothetical protein [Tanacetum cinerariifolium]
AGNTGKPGTDGKLRKLCKPGKLLFTASVSQINRFGNTRNAEASRCSSDSYSANLLLIAPLRHAGDRYVVRDGFRHIVEARRDSRTFRGILEVKG